MKKNLFALAQEMNRLLAPHIETSEAAHLFLYELREVVSRLTLYTTTGNPKALAKALEARRPLDNLVYFLEDEGEKPNLAGSLDAKEQATVAKAARRVLEILAQVEAGAEAA